MIERLDWTTLFQATDDMPADQREALDRYFEPFAQPPFTVDKDGKNDLGHQPCLKCRAPLVPDLAAALLDKAGFTWGIVHGEGHCRNCSWPARAHHFIKYKDGRQLVTIRNLILQYHPDFVIYNQHIG